MSKCQFIEKEIFLKENQICKDFYLFPFLAFSSEFDKMYLLSSRLAYESTFMCKEEVLGVKEFIDHLSG